MLAAPSRLEAGGAARATQGQSDHVRAIRVGGHLEAGQATALLLRCREDDRAGAVAEEDAGATIGEIDEACQQLGAEAERVSRRASEAAGVQDAKRTQDQWATGAAIVIFWPAAFFVGGDGPNAAELARLKGEFEAIEQASIQKNCGMRVQR